MPIDLTQLDIIEDALAIVKNPETGNMIIILPTCSAVKYGQGVTLKAKLDAQDALIADLTTRLAALEAGSLTWQGIPAASNANSNANNEE